MLTQQQKVAIRRHLGLPFAGTAQAGRLFGWRFEIHVEDLEYRMNNMQPDEEQLLTGVSMGSFKLSGRPTVGDLLAYTIDAVTVDYAVRSADFEVPPNPINPSDSSVLYSIALNSAIAINANATLAAAGYSAVGAPPADQFSPAYMPPYFAELLITGPGASAIALSSAATGTTNLVTDNPGSVCPIIATFTNPVSYAQSTLYGLIAVCDYLANSMTQAGLSLWLKSATGAGGAGVAFRGDEVRARRGLYKEFVFQLARAIGGEAYVRKFSGGGGRGCVA
jgi:hypothetical protein